MLMFTVGRTSRSATRDCSPPCVAARCRGARRGAPSPPDVAAAAWFAGTGACRRLRRHPGLRVGGRGPHEHHRRLASAGAQALIVIGQVTIADVVTILAIPLVLQPDRVLTRRKAVRSWPPAPSRCYRWLTDLPTALGASPSQALEAALLGARPAPVPPVCSLLVVDRRGKRDQRADRGIRHRSARGRARSAQATVRPRSAASPTGSSSRCSSSSSARGSSSAS